MNYRKLSGYSENQKGYFCGISRSFYYKWKGWSLLEAGASREELLKEVDKFYETFYFYPLRLDLVKDQELAFILLQFAIHNGKKKLKDKISLFVVDMDELNEISRCETNKLLLELLEFYYYIGDISKSIYLMEYYRTNS